MDRRYYSRTKIKIESIFFINDGPILTDFTGVIEDISEGGIRIFVDKERYKESVGTIAVGTNIFFQAYDEYLLYDEKKQEVFSGEVEVIRIEESEDGVHYGCRLLRLSDELAEYINNKKVSEYMKNGFSI